MKKIITATAIAAAALFTPIGVGISAPSTVATAFSSTPSPNGPERTGRRSVSTR